MLADRVELRERITEASLAASETTPALEHLRSPTPTTSMNQTAASSKNSSRVGRHFQGWRMGVTLGAITTGVVLVINLSVLIWGAAGAGFEGDLRTLQQGSCKKTKDMNLWLHLAINALSTLLLGASNYTMQCLSSPIREEINAAHRKHQWLDIGVPSLRNLKHISRGKLLLWCLVALSSVSIHLLYNSIVFSTLSAQGYTVFAASAELPNSTAFNWTLLDAMQHLKNASRWQALDNRDCIKTYRQDFVSANGDLLLVLHTTNMTGMVRSIMDVPGLGYGEPDWMCDVYDQTHYPAGCSVQSLLNEAANWTIFFRVGHDSANGLDLGSEGWMGGKVQYCLSEPVEEQCRVQISLVILGAVVACNAIKALWMLLTIRYQKSQPLVTIGDAIESFLQDPDRSTYGMCLASKHNFGNIEKEKSPISPTDRLWHSWLKSLHEPAWTAEPTEWKACRQWWFSAASPKRWLTCNFL